jgi:hypothetical protein
MQDMQEFANTRSDWISECRSATTVHQRSPRHAVEGIAGAGQVGVDAIRTQDRECFSKHRYATQLEADVVRNKRTDVGGRHLRVYACPHCAGYHLTKARVYEGPSAF